MILLLIIIIIIIIFFFVSIVIIIITSVAEEYIKNYKERYLADVQSGIPTWLNHPI